MNPSKILHIKNSMWQLTQDYLKNFKPNFNVFNEDIGRNFIKMLLNEKRIAIFQWKVQSRQKVTLLEYYCQNFLDTIMIFYIKNTKKLKGKKLKKFKNSNELKEYFNNQFKKYLNVRKREL